MEFRILSQRNYKIHVNVVRSTCL